MSVLGVLIIRAVYIGISTGIVIALPMGPAGLESIRWTLTRGLKKGILVAAGSLIADAIDIMFINFGLLSLIETNKLLEVFFWLLSGIIIFYIGYNAVKHEKSKYFEREEAAVNEDVKKSRPVFAGFIINVSNPMTHFFWLTLSSTVIRVWRSAGRLPYFIFAVSMLCGMFISLSGLNFLASKGRKFKVPKISKKAAVFIAYGITAIGTGFFIYGIYILYLYIKHIG